MQVKFKAHKIFCIVLERYFMSLATSEAAMNSDSKGDNAAQLCLTAL